MARSNSLILATVIAALAMTAGACSSGKSNQEHVDEANQRWLAMRSTLMLEMAHQQFETGDLDMAEQTVREATEMDPSNARLYTLGGRIMLERDRLERAYHLFNAAVSQDEDLAEAHYYKGVVLQRWQRFESAHAAYRRAYEIQPDEASYLLAVGEMLVELGRADDAIELYESRLEYFDQNASLRSALGHLHLMRDQPRRAVTYFREASVLDPSDRALRYELAMARAAAGDHPRAIRELRTLLADPKTANRRDLRLALARSYRELGQFDQARNELTRLARGERGEASDWRRLAELSWEMGEVNDTLYAARRATELDPRQAMPYVLTGLALTEREQYNDAVIAFDRALALEPADASAMILRGIALQRAGRAADAVASYEAALELEPDDRRLHQLIERARTQSGG